MNVKQYNNGYAFAQRELAAPNADLGTVDARLRHYADEARAGGTFNDFDRGMLAALDSHAAMGRMSTLSGESGMYLVRNGAVFQLFQDRATAEMNKGSGQLFVAVRDSDGKDELEMLYSLAGTLLDQSGLNPLMLTLTLTRTDGEIEEISAVKVMNNARRYIDSITEVPN